MSQQPIPDDLLENVQGDILVGIPKKTQLFFFFSIDASQIEEFRTQLGNLIPIITTGKGTSRDRKRIVQFKRSKAKGLVSVTEVNIAFSHTGVQKLGFNTSADDKIGDAVFDAGMQADIANIADNEKNWLPEFISSDPSTAATDGLILIGGDSHESLSQALADITAPFGTTINEILVIIGDTRPGAESGHEHFGFNDGISQPAVSGVDTPLPGQDTVPQGIILLGRDSDPVTTRPEWAKDGSFLAFRQLAQLVPEFDEFLTANALTINDPSAPKDLGKDLLGARIVGRWKSGAPVELAPLQDDPELAADPQRNNNFDFSQDLDQSRCPFAGHVRKTNPRADLAGTNNGLTPHRIIRRGITFGPEVTPEEQAAKKTSLDRGLLFVSYQSSVANGFQFVQKSWANNPNFIFGKTPAPGFDPLVGQNADDTSRTTTGLDGSDPAKELDLGTQEWVISQGGEYYFSPSISGLKAFAGVA